MYEDTKLILEAAKARQAKSDYRYNREKLEAVSEAADKAAIWDKLYSRNDDAVDFLDFKKKVTDAYVVEALTIIVDNCLSPVLIREEYHQKLVRQLVTNFVNEEGSSKLLRKFKGTSYLLSEVAYAIDTTVQSVIEAAKEDKTDSLKLNKEDKEKFYAKLEKVDVDDAVTKISDRVRTQQQEFVNNNMEEKAALSAALSKTQSKVENNKAKLAEKANSDKEKEKAEKLEESYIFEGKRKMADIRSSRTKNIFECMVYNLSKSAMVNESASNVFVENSKINMDKVVEHCETLCTFLTTLDSLKIIDINESYIEKMLEDMKK
jgi:hypothetical protein